MSSQVCDRVQEAVGQATRCFPGVISSMRHATKSSMAFCHSNHRRLISTVPSARYLEEFNLDASIYTKGARTLELEVAFPTFQPANHLDFANLGRAVVMADDELAAACYSPQAAGLAYLQPLGASRGRSSHLEGAGITGSTLDYS